MKGGHKNEVLNTIKPKEQSFFMCFLPIVLGEEDAYMDVKGFS